MLEIGNWLVKIYLPPIKGEQISTILSYSASCVNFFNSRHTDKQL